MYGVMGSIYSGVLGVASWHLIMSFHQMSSYHAPNSTLYLSHRSSSLSLSETPRGSPQLGGSSQPGSIICSHSLPTLLEPEPLFLTNNFWKAARGVAEFDDRLTAFWLCRSTTNGAPTQILVQKAELGIVGKTSPKHIQVNMERFN